jgi:hypothetical protein
MGRIRNQDARDNPLGTIARYGPDRVSPILARQTTRAWHNKTFRAWQRRRRCRQALVPHIWQAGVHQVSYRPVRSLSAMPHLPDISPISGATALTEMVQEAACTARQKKRSACATSTRALAMIPISSGLSHHRKIQRRSQDLTGFTRKLMAQAENDLGTQLDWVAVNHFDTGQPHIHIVLRGKDLRQSMISMSIGNISLRVYATGQNEIVSQLSGG